MMDEHHAQEDQTNQAVQTIFAGLDQRDGLSR